MTPDEKAYLKKAVAGGAVYSTPIHAGDRVPCSQAINCVTPAQPWGHPQDVEAIIYISESNTSFPSAVFKTIGACFIEVIFIVGICKILVDLF